MKKYLSQEEKWIVYGIAPLFLLGSIFHFLYDFTGKNIVVASFSAVNESIWEHEKLMIVPIAVWWIGYYVINGKALEIDREKWFFGMLASFATAILLMPMIFYSYTRAFGIELLGVDIFLLFFCVAVGQLIGLHMYRYARGIPVWTSVGIVFLVMLFMIMATYNPPKLPLFRDSVDGLYGIK